MFLLSQILKRIMSKGTLTVFDSTGKEHYFRGREDGPVLTLRIHSKAAERKLALYPKLFLGEAYMDGDITVEGGSIYDFLDLMTRNLGWGSRHPLASLGDTLFEIYWFFRKFNPRGRSRRNVAHHYDIGEDLYELFLDENRQYSCAYFKTPGDSLEQAQRQIKAHIAAKLALKPGQKVLDIGCGWGGLARFLSTSTEVQVTGVTLSTNQHAYAVQKAKETGLEGRVDYRLTDYRDVTEKFDRIVSVGMFEHVGVPHYDKFFRKVRDILTDDGVALIHTIGTADRPSPTNAWIDKYIFPGGYIPPLSQVTPAIERAGLYVTDIEILRLHYAETLRAWRQRFLANIERVREMYDDRFCRMWEYYLAASEVSFRNSGLVVFQIQLAKRVADLPLTRDYIHQIEENDLSPRIAAE